MSSVSDHVSFVSIFPLECSVIGVDVVYLLTTVHTGAMALNDVYGAAT